MKILFYIQNMKGGGAARLLAIIANELCARNYEVLIATNLHNKIAYSLDEKIKMISLYKDDSYNVSRLRRFVTQIQSARRIAIVEKPDVIVTLLPPVSFYTRIAVAGLHIPIIFCDVTSYARKDSPFVHFVRYHFYRFADAVTIQTNNDKKILGNRIPKKVVINNPLSYPVVTAETQRTKSVLSIGHTLEWEIKGMDLLIKAFGLVSHKHPEWILNIAGGSTPETIDYLNQLISENNVEGKVQFIGFQSHIDEVMRTSSVFALSSRIEGFSLSLVEALSQGCPAVSFKIKGVITDVTDNGHGTLLTEDYSVEEFASNLDKLMSDESLRRRLADDGKEFVKKYQTKSIVDQWVALFNKLKK